LAFYNAVRLRQAAEAGQRLGLERRGQDISQQEEQQKLGMSQAEMANNAALEQQKMQMQAAESAQQQAVERQRIQATQEIAANRMRLATDAAARKFQQQQAYQQAIQSGMDPIKAMMQFGPTMGQSMSGVGQLGLTQAKNRMAEILRNLSLIRRPGFRRGTFREKGQYRFLKARHNFLKRCLLATLLTLTS